MRTFEGIEALAAQAGTDLGSSDWHTVTQQQVDLFAQATGDHQWIHVDPERAARGPFGATIAHGYLTLALVPLLVGEVYTLTGVRLALNYGCDKVRFPAPVPVGSRVRGRVHLDAVTPSPSGFLVAATVTVEVEGAAKPACVATTLAVVVP